MYVVQQGAWAFLYSIEHHMGLESLDHLAADSVALECTLMWYVQLLHAFLHRAAINQHQLLSDRRTKALPAYRYPEPSTRKDYPLSKMVSKNQEQENPSNMSGSVRVAPPEPFEYFHLWCTCTTPNMSGFPDILG